MQNKKPARIVRNGVSYDRRTDGSYRAGNGSILDDAVVIAVVSGSGSPGCTVEQGSGSTPSGGHSGTPGGGDGGGGGGGDGGGGI
jgi:hypothetical protein